MSDEERSSVRKKTSEYRYVTVSFNVVMVDKEVNDKPVGEVLQRLEVKLVKSKLKPEKQKMPPRVKRKPGKVKKMWGKKEKQKS